MWPIQIDSDFPFSCRFGSGSYPKLFTRWKRRHFFYFLFLFSAMPVLSVPYRCHNRQYFGKHFLEKGMFYFYIWFTWIRQNYADPTGSGSTTLNIKTSLLLSHSHFSGGGGGGRCVTGAVILKIWLLCDQVVPCAGSVGPKNTG